MKKAGSRVVELPVYQLQVAQHWGSGGNKGQILDLKPSTRLAKVKPRVTQAPRSSDSRPEPLAKGPHVPPFLQPPTDNAVEQNSNHLGKVSTGLCLESPENHHCPWSVAADRASGSALVLSGDTWPQ